MNAEQFFNNGFGADVEKIHRKHVIELMTNFAKHYHTEQCNITNVVGQSEQLCQYEPDNFDKLVIALKDIVIEWKGKKAEDIANEIKNRIDCYYLSDREISQEEQSGVRDNFFEIQDVLNAL